MAGLFPPLTASVYELLRDASRTGACCSTRVVTIVKVIDGVVDENDAVVGWFVSAGGGDTTMGGGLCTGGWSCFLLSVSRLAM